FWQSHDSAYLKSASYLKPEEISWLAAVLKPIAKISEDVITYFKPYKDVNAFKNYSKKVAGQPLRGLDNIFTGVAKLFLATPIILLMGLVNTIKKRSLTMLGLAIYHSSRYFFTGVTQVIRGVWQIGSFPAALASIASRAICTVIRSKPSNKLVDVKPQINIMVNACEKVLAQKQRNSPNQRLANAANVGSHNSINNRVNESSSLLVNKKSNNTISDAGACRAFQDLSRQLGKAKSAGLISQDQLPVLTRFGLFAKDGLKQLDAAITEQLQKELTALQTITV
ncbi:MAG: hypothetical protein ACK4PR_03140, partial [Gammaproteobacteria bacterium]